MNNRARHGANEEAVSKRGGSNFLRRLLKTIAWIAGIWLLSLAILQAVLSPSVLTRIVNRFASEYIDGTLSFGEARMAMFRHFPNIGISLEDCSITYPSEKFDSLKKPEFHQDGTGEDSDTLACFRHFSAGINIGSLIAGKVSVPHIILSQPRIFAHRYDSLNANWDVFRSSNDTSGTDLPPVKVGKIRLINHPHIVYSDSKDSLFAMLDVKKMTFDGRWDSGRNSRNKVEMSIDSLIIAGRIAADTLGFRLNRLQIQEEDRQVNISAQANTTLATGAFGRMSIPIDIEGQASFPRDTVPALEIDRLNMSIASIPVNLNGSVRREAGQTEVDGHFRIDGCNADEILKGFIRNFFPETEKIRTDAVISMQGSCNGIIGNGLLPSIQAHLQIPRSYIGHKDIEKDVNIALEASVVTDTAHRVKFSLDEFIADAPGMNLKISAGAEDITGEDPDIIIDGKISADLAPLTGMLPDSHGIKAEGKVEAQLKGNIKKSQIDIYNFAQAALEGFINSDRIIIDSPKDSLSLSVLGLNINAGPETLTSRRDQSSKRNLLSISGKIDSTDISYRASMALKGRSLEFSVKNSAEAFSERDTSRVYPLGGHLNAGTLAVKDAEGMSISLSKTSNRFLMMPKKGHPEVPVMSVSSTNGKIFVRDLNNRFILTDASVQGKAAMNTVERRQRRKEMLDSLAAIYPQVHRDSLFRHHLRQMRDKEVPSWITEEDFKAQDINLKLDESLAKYFREWDIEGSMNVRTGIFMTPYLPLRNILKGLEVNFDNNNLNIDKFSLLAGDSEISANGSLSGLRRALLGRGTYVLDLNISSEKMDADALLAAISAGSEFTPLSDAKEMEKITDAEFLQMVVADSLSTDTLPDLVVIPANLNATVGLDARNIKFSGLEVNSLSCDIIVKERCMQILNTSVSTNVGAGSFEGFYATRTKKDIRTGFNLALSDVTTEKVISLMPAIDTIMPLLKSFKGLVDCEFAATASLDTNMNIITPSINGVMRIEGEDLSMSGEKVFTDLAKKLKFKDKEEGRIDRMTVEGIIQDNTIEVFPFIVDIDRYTMALSGKHNFDQSFRYHVSLIRSPMVFKVGVDLYGPDFDSMKFKIGKPKYKNTNVPVFTEVIDQTRINLGQSIKNIFEKGVDAAIRENEKQDAIATHKKEIGYVNAVDQQMEELSEDEKKLIEDDNETETKEKTDKSDE